eukprot:6176620-Pleurochrysis_carterae.AAC.1
MHLTRTLKQIIMNEHTLSTASCTRCLQCIQCGKTLESEILTDDGQHSGPIKTLASNMSRVSGSARHLGGSVGISSSSPPKSSSSAQRFSSFFSSSAPMVIVRPACAACVPRRCSAPWHPLHATRPA